jgi:hypothetical protein
MSKSEPNYIPHSEVPERKNKWGAIFDGIPKDMALVLDGSTVSVGAIRTSLHRYKSSGKYTTYSVLFRANKIFVLHSAEVPK